MYGIKSKIECKKHNNENVDIDEFCMGGYTSRKYSKVNFYNVKPNGNYDSSSKWCYSMVVDVPLCCKVVASEQDIM